MATEEDGGAATQRNRKKLEGLGWRWREKKQRRRIGVRQLRWGRGIYRYRYTVEGVMRSIALCLLRRRHRPNRRPSADALGKGTVAVSERTSRRKVRVSTDRGGVRNQRGLGGATGGPDLLTCSFLPFPLQSSATVRGQHEDARPLEDCAGTRTEAPAQHLFGLDRPKGHGCKGLCEKATHPY